MAETSEKIIFTDNFNRADTAVSSNTANGEGYGVGNGWEETTYGYAQIKDNALLLSGSGNMGSKKYMTNRVMRTDFEASLNQTVSITIDVSEISASRFPVLWLRCQPKVWKRTTANGYLMFVTGTYLYFAKSVDNTYTALKQAGCSIASKAVGEITITFTATQKDATTTVLTGSVSGVDSAGVAFDYNWFSQEDTTEGLQLAGNVGVSYVDGDGGSMAIDNFTYTTADDAAPVHVITDTFDGEALSDAWSGTKEGILSLENGSMAIGFNGSYDSNSRINNRAVFQSEYYGALVNQFVEVEVPVSDIDNKAVAGEGASYPTLWLRDQTVGGAQIGYFADYNSTAFSINRRNADGTVTTIANSSYFVLNGSNTYATDDNIIFQFSAIGTNPTVLTARIYASFSATEEQPSLVCSVTGTDSNETLEIETAGVPSIAIHRTTTDALPVHIEKFVYYTYGALDYSALVSSITEAQNILAKSDEYRKDSISGLQAALTEAQSVLTMGGLTQPDVDSAVAKLQAEINKAERFPSITEIKVNGINAEFADGQYNVTLSKTCTSADFDVKTNFTDGVTVTVNNGNSLEFTENEKSYTVTLNYNKESENYTVNALRGTKNTVIATSGDNGSITNAGVTYAEDGSSLTYTVAADEGYCVKTFTVDGVEISLPADNSYTFSNITGDHTISVEFEKMLVMVDSATVYLESNGGIRFSADVSQSGIAHLERQLAAGVIKDYTLGTVMLPTDLLGEEELTIDSENVLNIKRTVWKDAVNDGYKRMTAVITNVHAKNYNRAIAARVYLTVTDVNGNVSTLYSDFNEAKNVARVRNLAQELLKDTSAYSNSELAILKNYAELPVSVTAEQQALLNENLAARHITVEADIDVPFSIALFNDAHLISTDGEYDSEAQKTSAKARKIYFQKAEEKLMRGLSYADKLSDLKKVVFIGDTVDASTKDTWLSFQSIVGDRINKTIVTPGNHEFTDYTDGFPADATARDAYYSKFSSYFNNNPNFHSEIVDGVNLVAMDNALEYFTAEQVTKLQAEIDKGYPIILFYHVPLNMDGLAAEDTIVMNEDTRAMYNLINANSDIIKAAFCGHAHKEYNGFLNGGKVPQYVLNATYGGEGGRTTIITVGDNILVVPNEPADDDSDIFSSFRIGSMTKTENSIYSEVYTNKDDNTVVRYLSLGEKQTSDDIAYITMMADSHISTAFRPENAQYVENGLKYAENADMVVMLGDTIDSSTMTENVEALKETVWDKYPNNICVLGNHELTYATDKAAQREKLEEIWPHNTVYAKKIVKDKLYLIGMDNASESYSFTEEQCELLKADIKEARENNAQIILLQHISPVALDNTLGANAKMAEILANNGDVIMGIFAGHNHIDALDYVASSYENENGNIVETSIPCYRLASSKYDEAKNNYGANVLVVAVNF